ncbi:G-type lectin S-receptor-like serine/threonine-protein kinase RKS1 [Argentina anserina]|uniref:G-type lectin S-receptor-like serine/threonine-protein kinase RKS1 n=1 Tax=Argentina anserina TaxID=57926 RepID=UPI002176547E|nr:G-type lectin S-receptor-like serine/threonine-protein kinase RKS1 [Potentilla anserina]
MFLTPFLLFFSFPLCISIDTIGPNQYVKDSETIVSKAMKFELGFFSPGNSSYRYVGIWYANIPEKPVIWMANRDNPIKDSSGVLTNRYGNLVLYAYKENLTIWSAKVSVQTTSSTSAQILDTGNLVLVKSNSVDYIWQSFDYPTDTVIPGMKIGLNHKTGLDSFLTSWKSENDPGIGDYSYRLSLNGSPQFSLYNGSSKYFRTAMWPWSPSPSTTPYAYDYNFVHNQVGTYLIDSSNKSSEISRLVLQYNGILQHLIWNDVEGQWKEVWAAPKYKCDPYGHCGPFSECSLDNIRSECSCLPGYQPSSSGNWSEGIWSDGCVTKQLGVSIKCGKKFVKVEHVKLPDASISGLLDTRMGESECKRACQNNCSCVAFSSLEIDGGGGCMTWYGKLMDILILAELGRDFYIRADGTESAENDRKPRGFLKRRGMLAVLIIPALLVLSLIMLAYWWLIKRKTEAIRLKSTWGRQYSHSSRHPDLQLFHLSTIIAATDDFSLANKLGEGGFGSVYVGQLSNQQKIAVKRLSKSSRQGVEEFKNEVTLIAKLQHRNLVKLLGCCVEEEEKLLIYEYLPNKSLDFFLFDQTRRSALDWRNRFAIITGVARGILYLHEDSRLRIVHRDLKASNVLLDADMKPKISDFGLARIFDGDQLQDETRTIVGTYGYMSPEYAAYGKFSTKSDVFSFGVILLEIISGKKNNASYEQDHSLNLIGHVWHLWREQNILDIVDVLLQSYNVDEVLRFLQIGLLCLEENATDRPTMSEVVLMLSGERALASPQRPAFIFKKTFHNSAGLLITDGFYSTNGMTVTKVVGR